jgi:HEPN domain-containing protein
MVDIKKQIEYWRHGAREDWELAADLVERGKSRYGLFFAYLALEKLLKAHVCLATQDLAPRTHASLRLIDLTKLSLTSDQRLFLSEFDRYQIEGRYPDNLSAQPTSEEGIEQLRKAEEILRWLMQQL